MSNIPDIPEGYDFPQNYRLTGIPDVDMMRTVGSPMAVPIGPHDLPATFPYAVWAEQWTKYQRYWSEFTGAALNVAEEKDEKGNPIELFPLRINLIKTAMMKANYVLWGEVPDNASALAPMKCTPKLKAGQKKATEAETRIAKEAEYFINATLKENYARTLQQDAGLVQQFLGGIVLRLKYDPEDDELENQIRIEQVLPDFFMPVWDTGRMNNLLEAWVVYRLPSREAELRFGVKTDGANPVYAEHWTKTTITITLDGNPIKHIVNGEVVTYDNAPNPFGKVPFIYIPRERAGGYFGLSGIDDLTAMVREINSQWANIGDVVARTADRKIFVRNTTQTIDTIPLGADLEAINLGTTPSGTTMEPDMMPLDPPKLEGGLVDHPQNLLAQFIRDSFGSGVAYGEDEGSQRSALTLAFRMWPLTSKIRAIRNNWTDGMVLLSKLMIRMAIEKGIGGMTLEHLAVNFEVDWSPMVPRDDEAESAKIFTSVQSHVLGIKSAIKLLRQVEDPDQEYEEILEFIKLMAKLEQMGKPDKPLTKRKTQGQQDAGTKPIE